MRKDITWGQYHSVDSMIHRIDPRVKIRFTIIYIILLLLDRNLPLFLFLTTVFAGVWACSRVPMRKMIRGTKGVFIFILICSILNAFTMHGTTLVKLGVLTITKEGLIKAGFVFWRMLLLILMSSLLMYTTTPTRLTDGMEKCMHLSGGVAMGITIALRFVPILFGELDRIMKAQMARGADFKKGNPVVRRTPRSSSWAYPARRLAAFPECNLACRTSGRCDGQPLLYGRQRTDEAASTRV